MNLTSPWSRLSGFYRRRSASWVFRKPFLIRSERPLVSFTFDDFPRSALITGGRILESYGFKGTYYASLGLAGQETASGQAFVLDDLSPLFERGHELGCHTFGHCHSWDTSPSAFEDSILANADALRALQPGVDFKTFSYPISMPRPFTKSKTARHFLCCRGGGQRANSGQVDLNQLSAFFLEQSRDSIQHIRDTIDQNQKQRGWLIFATHDISDDPTAFGCRPGFFEEVVRYAANSGALVLPVVQALEVLRAGTISGNREKLDLAERPTGAVSL